MLGFNVGLGSADTQTLAVGERATEADEPELGLNDGVLAGVSVRVGDGVGVNERVPVGLAAVMLAALRNAYSVEFDDQSLVAGDATNSHSPLGCRTGPDDEHAGNDRVSYDHSATPVLAAYADIRPDWHS